MQASCGWDAFDWNGYSIHKLDIMFGIVLLDIASVILIMVFMSRLEKINNEYLAILEKNVVKMSKFTVEIRQIKLDKTV